MPQREATNTIEVNADANDTLSNSSLTISGNSVSGTDTITLDNVNTAQLTGGPSNDTFTLDGWSGTHDHHRRHGDQLHWSWRPAR